MNYFEIVDAIVNHVRLYYCGVGGFKGFCDKHNISYNSAKKVYYYNGKYFDDYQGVAEQIKNAIIKDKGDFNG